MDSFPRLVHGPFDLYWDLQLTRLDCIWNIQLLQMYTLLLNKVQLAARQGQQVEHQWELCFLFRMIQRAISGTMGYGLRPTC